MFFPGQNVVVPGHFAFPCPEGVPVDEKVTIGRIGVVQQILELRAEHRSVVEHKVQLQVQPQLLQSVQVFPAGIGIAEGVIDHRKAAV